MRFRTRNKYGARKTTYNGIIYDSKAEAELACDIDILIKAGEVSSVERQKRYILYGRGGNQICAHIVDFELTMKDGSIEIWECKGMETKDYKLKHKLFVDNYPDIKYLVMKR